MSSYINASSPSGNGDRIKLLSKDLIFGGIDNIFIYPSLDIDRLQDAVSRTLSFWPVLTGRILVHNDEEYFIECSDHPIPFTSTENDQMEQWPDLPVLVDDTTTLQPFIDSIQYKPETEPLLRLKLTRLVRSGEYVFGTSFSHTVGDADANLHFLNDLSQIYQYLEPILPRPVFQRHSLREENPQITSLRMLKLYNNTHTRETVIARIVHELSETEPVNMSFTSEHLTQLHLRAGGDQTGITAHDALCAYIILLMNKHSFVSEDDYIRCAFISVNYRGISDALATKAYAGNALIQPLTDDFPSPLSLSSIAKTIRQLINTIRDEEFFQNMIASTAVLMTKFIKNGEINFVWEKNEIIFNSNYKYDWANLVNFGMTNRCRFHTMGLFKFYIRIFPLNPVKGEDGNWTKDNGGVEVAFRIPKGEFKEKFLEAWKKDRAENFTNVK